MYHGIECNYCQFIVQSIILPQIQTPAWVIQNKDVPLQQKNRTKTWDE